MNDLQTFTNAAFGSVRILYEDGKPLFCGADACKALGYSNQRDALNRHCRYIVKRDVPHPQSVSKTVRPAGSQPAFAWNTVSIPIRPHYKVGVRFFQRSLPAFLSAFLAVSFPNFGESAGLTRFT